METIGKKFKSFRMIIIENDSKDGTDKSLATFAESRPEFVELISEKMDGKPDPNAPADPLPGDFALSALRFYKMAKLRNIYMDRLAKLPQISQPNTLVMMVDLDLAKISIEGTLGSLSSILAGKKKLDSDWDLVCANGLTSECNKESVGKQACSFVRKDNGKFGRSYDSLATRFTDQEMEHSFQIPAGQPRPPKFDVEWGNHQQYTRIKTNDRDADPIPAKSCFGGLAVYKAQSIKNLRYEGGDCEHISFNGKLDKVYIVPDFNTYYD
ncbi:Hypothetical Protein FCC1311_091882 [Hondaea fermentalgiana]|uniref:Uncharacterized protein n=1 Tax=Hondaea fermentalgiana TaxID=2315210 RepID=A0A2R5GQ08_9STRA|nr:Hypothetical Protein FCC1311_091882 [Hondaea fermentalgiana]|eukprot:GBG32962.1 Hypothetical Protein FCC1311_091882 [Hondaea fermentalgiana]